MVCSALLRSGRFAGHDKKGDHPIASVYVCACTLKELYSYCSEYTLEALMVCQVVFFLVLSLSAFVFLCLRKQSSGFGFLRVVLLVVPPSAVDWRTGLLSTYGTVMGLNYLSTHLPTSAWSAFGSR